MCCAQAYQVPDTTHLLSQVAIKRSNVLLSVLVGGLVFKENIVKRIPYVLLMLCGMTFIVLDPKS
jgi:hypothetical protein